MRPSAVAAAVAQNNPLDDRQPDAGAFVLLGAVHALEHAEQLVAIAHIKAHAVVFNRVNSCCFALGLAGDRDHRRVAPAGVLDRVARPVEPDLLSGAVGLAGGQVAVRISICRPACWAVARSRHWRTRAAASTQLLTQRLSSGARRPASGRRAARLLRVVAHVLKVALSLGRRGCGKIFEQECAREAVNRA